MDSESKANQVSAPPLETTPGPVLVRMLEVVPSEESEGGDKEATASSKEAVWKGGIENSSPQGKRTASEDPETMASKWAKKSSLEGPAPENAPAVLHPRGDQLSSEL